MVGIYYVLLFSIIVAAVLVVPLFMILFPGRKKNLFRIIGFAAILIAIFSYMSKSIFTVFMGILPFFVISGIAGLYLSIKHIRKAAIERRFERSFNIFLLLFFIGYFIFVMFGRAWVGVPVSGLADATQIEKIDESTDFNNLRLVPPELAGALSRTKNTFSNYHVGEKDVYYDPEEKRLKWVAALEPDNILIGLTRDSPGFIEGYAGGTLNPSVDYEADDIKYTEERPLLYNIYTRAWLEDPTHEYGDAYLVKSDGGGFLWIVPLQRSYFGIIKTYDGIATVDAHTGETHVYTADEIPEELSGFRAYPMDVASWRVEVYSLYKHGIINALFFKNDIDEIPENTEPYLVNINDEVYWFISVEPAGGQEKRALSGYYLIGANAENAGEATFVNKREKNFIGPTVASNYVESKISNFVDWEAVQPLLYPYKGRETWVVPILYTGGESSGMKLVGVGFVDTDTEEVSIITPDGEGSLVDDESTKEELIRQYEIYRDEIKDRLDKIDEIITKLEETE